MDDTFGRGMAFIMEGDTEKEFYLALLDYLCRKHGACLERREQTDEPDIAYYITINSQSVLVKFNVVGTITQIPQSGKWFNTQCVGKYSKNHEWSVFLCYDTEEYQGNVTKYHEGDWKSLRSSLKRTARIIDLAAAADIEDVILQDLAGVCHYLGCNTQVQLRGRKGKVKIKNLFRENGCYYHEGERAKYLIASLDFQVIIDSNIVSLEAIERILFP